jgi:hypothetical protein
MTTNIFDAFDEQSQTLLQGLKPIDFEGLQRGFSNKKLLGETSNNKSQLTDYKWQFLKRNSIEIKDLFFKNITLFKKGNLTLIQEPECNCNIDPKEFTVYRENGTNDGFQPNEDEFLFKIKIFTGTRGEVIKQAYYECKVEDNEALFFIEDNNGDVSKAKMYAKFGNKVSKDILLSLSNKDNELASTLKKTPGINEDVLKELIRNGVYEEKSSVIRVFVTGFYKFIAYIGMPTKALGWVCEKLGEGIIEYLSLPESVWNARGEDYFLKKENILETLIIDPKIIDFIRKKFEDDPTKFEFNDLIPDFIIKNINKGLTVIETLIKKHNQYITAFINDLYHEYETAAIIFNIQNHVTENVALICGIWNGLVDFLGGLLVFIGQIVQLQYNIGSALDDYLERFDSFCVTVSELNWAEVSKAFKNVYNQISNYLKENTENDYNYDKIAYFTGFAIAFIGTMFIPFTAFAKPLNIINKLKKATVPTELIEKVSQVSTKTANFVIKVGKETSDTALKLIDDILALLAKGANGIEEFLKKIWKKIVEWFVENKDKYTELIKYGKALLKRTAETYTKKYPEGKLYKILKTREAYKLYGKLGKKLVQEVDVAFENIVKNAKTISEYKQKVMINGMLYKKDKTQKVFTAFNFTDKEIKAGKVTEFIESLHPILKKRYELHLKEITKGLKAPTEMIKRAGIAASHGEIRAINQLLYHLEETGLKLTDDVFKDIMGYNRFLVKEGSQPPCVHCFYLTDGVQFLKFNK